MQMYRIRQKLALFGAEDKLQTVRGVGFKLVP
jgi:DNA-binding response OmpR family regulator